ncbi:hypothetical protein R0J87_18945, partial [Halomonas sp. SIMBA_159]
WGDVLRELDRLQQASIEHDGKTWQVRTEATGTVTALAKAVGIALPPRVQTTGPPEPEHPSPPRSRKRRGRPRHGATSA